MPVALRQGGGKRIDVFLETGDALGAQIQLGLQLLYAGVARSEVALQSGDTVFAGIDVRLQPGEEVVEERALALASLQALEIARRASPRLIQLELHGADSARVLGNLGGKRGFPGSQRFVGKGALLLRAIERQGCVARGLFEACCLLLQRSVEVGDRRIGCRRSRVSLGQVPCELVGALLGNGAIRAHLDESSLVFRELLDFSLEPILDIAEVGGEGAQVGLELAASISGARA